MNHDLIRKILYQAIKTLIVIFVILIVTAIIQVESVKKSPEEIQNILAEQKRAMQAVAEGRSVNENLPDVWPPQMNKVYPNLSLIDQDGKSVNLHDFDGKIIIVEYIDFSSAISQAQSGAGLLGKFGQEDLEIDRYALPFAEVIMKNDIDIDLTTNDIIQLKIILYAAAGNQATREDAENWANHFNLTTESSVIVAVPEKDMRDADGSLVIGGYQLIDKNLKLRVDSSGIAPKHNLNMTFIPLFEKLAKK